MKKLIGAAVLVIMILAAGYFSVSHLSRPQSETDKYFYEVLDDYPWVRYAVNHQSEKELAYYEQIKYLYSVHKQTGLNLLNASWLQDYVSEDEARALSLLVDIQEKEPEIALRFSQTLWFQNGISTCEVSTLEHVLALTESNVEVAKKLAASDWFFLARACKVEEGTRVVMELPPELAVAVSNASWFIFDPTLSQLRAVQELIRLYPENKDLALGLVKVYQPEDFEALQQVSQLCLQDRELVDLFLSSTTLSRESFLALSDLSQIARSDRELALSLVGEAALEKSQILSSLAGIYSHDPALGEIVSKKFSHNRIALRYIEKVLQVEDINPELLDQVALFVTANPEFVFEDRTEPFRYHLLTQIIAAFPLDTAQDYKNLIFVTCSVYGNRFYLWQDSDSGALVGWSSDRQLADLENEAVMGLLRFLIEKNEEGALVTDLRMEGYNYLYGVVDVPFTHLVNYDGTIVEAPQGERGTSYVFAIIYNITTLEERWKVVQEKLGQVNEMKYSRPNRVVNLILKEGKKKDLIFLYFCAKNWELGLCMDQAMQTRMDSIVMGISTTTMHWTASDTAHIYPAYIPSSSLAEKIQSDPRFYDNPFMYKGFISPYDAAGFKNSLQSDIESVTIYDVQVEGKVGLYNRLQDSFLADRKAVAVLMVGAAILALIVLDVRRILK